MVASIDDGRLRFFNLPTNSGGQSGPHNYALSVAQGDYLFYLNQDDFYFPDHIATSVAFLEGTGADIVWAPVALPKPINRNSEDWRDQPVVLDGVSASGSFDPEVFAISSSWAMLRTVADRIGPWKPANETPLSPSQEYLFRCWKNGCDIKYHPHVSVLCIHSGVRRNSYSSRDFSEHERYFNLIFNETDGFAKLMEQIALSMETLRRKPLAESVGAALRLVPKLLIQRFLNALGIHPRALVARTRALYKGSLIPRHRELVLEPPFVRKGDVVRMGQKGADKFLGFGWSIPEGEYRWTENRNGQLSFRLDEQSRPDRLVIKGRPLKSQIVEFRIEGQNPIRFDYSDGRDTAELPLLSPVDPVSLTISVSQTVRPNDLDGKDDFRTLGFSATEIAFL